MTNLELDRKFAITTFQIQRSFRACVKLRISENTLPEAVPCAVHFSAKPINLRARLGRATLPMGWAWNLDLQTGLTRTEL